MTVGQETAPAEEQRVIDWRCDKCHDRIGTIVGTRVFVRIDRHEMRAPPPFERKCGRCGHLNFWPRARPEQSPSGPVAP